MMPARSKHLLFQWNANSFEPEVPIQLEDTSLLQIDAVPDGRSLLFLSRDAYLFWRNPRETFRLPVRATSYYCFSADGRSFYFLDPYEWKIYTLDLSDAFATRKGYSQRASPEPTGIEVFPGLLNIAGGNGQFWLGYPDSIVAYGPSGANNRLWGREQVFQLAYRPPNYTRGQAPYLWLNPQARSAIYTNDTSAVFFQIPENYTEPLQPGHFFAGGGIDVTGNSALLAIYKIGMLDEGSTLSLYDPASGQIHYKALVPANQPDKILQAGPAPDNAAIPGLLAAQNWLAYRNGAETVALARALNRPSLTVPSPKSGLNEITGAFHANEKEFACKVEPNSVVLFDLSSGQALAGRKFGGEVLQLYFVPQTDEILVVHLVESQNASLEQTVIKLWDPQEPETPIRTVRLQGYEIQEVAFSKKHGFIAFTDGIDIRVFHQNDLLDETIRIRQNGTHIVMAIEFHPEDNMLAAGYEDGSVVFWDIASGQARFTWSAPGHNHSEEPVAIARLFFTEQQPPVICL